MIQALTRLTALSHTVFALPFALAATWLAWDQVDVTWLDLVLIVACMTFARASAMGFNRLADRDIDGANPRTVDRVLPSGALSVEMAWAFTLANAAAFVVCAGLLGELTLWLSPIALAVVWGYSLAKRYTMWCHVVLGLAQALAPTAVWIALTGGWGWTPALLSVAVGSWIAGFDIIYASQDAGFDADAGLHSLPSRLGTARALQISAALHVLTALTLAALPLTAALSPVYYGGWAVVVGVLAWEHSLVSPTDLSKVNKAFFDLNGYIAFAFLATVMLS